MMSADRNEVAGIKFVDGKGGRATKSVGKNTLDKVKADGG